MVRRTGQRVALRRALLLERLPPGRVSRATTLDGVNVYFVVWGAVDFALSCAAIALSIFGLRER